MDMIALKGECIVKRRVHLGQRCATFGGELNE